MSVLGIRSAPTSAELIGVLDQSEEVDLRFVARYDAFFDNPIPFLAEQLDLAIEDPRFVIAWRPEAEWVASMEWLFGPGLDRLDDATRQLGDRVHQAVYGITTFDAEVLAAVHREHYDNLRLWSAERSDVLWLDLSQGLDWEPLCGFIGCDPPATQFPRVNSSSGD